MLDRCGWVVCGGWIVGGGGWWGVHVSFCALGGGVENVNRRFCGLSGKLGELDSAGGFRGNKSHSPEGSPWTARRQN